MFTERYIKSLSTSNLKDDEFNHNTDALAAAACADGGGHGVLGSLLARVKFAGGPMHKSFEAGGANLAELLKAWHAEVEKKGRDRRWIKIHSERDGYAAHRLHKSVAEKSLAHWLDPNCKVCNGTKRVGPATCKDCFGSGVAAIECTGQFERGKILDMVSELQATYDSHSARASAKLRRAA